VASSIAWLDHSERDRSSMLAIIDLFRERSTIDELGLQPIWDSFAELLFPGTGTVQTRARYFLFIPWIFEGVRERKTPSGKASATVHRDEIRLIRALIAGGANQIGIIGRVAQAELKRMPSGIYWSGLGRWAIRRYPGSADQLLRSYDGIREMARTTVRTDDGETLDGPVQLWDRALPSPPDRFLDEPIRLELERHEAGYLRDRIADAAPGSLLDVMLDRPVPRRPPAFPWLHPAANRFPAALLQTLDHAERYSRAMHGAQLLYNLLLVRAKGIPEWIESFEGRLAAWAADPHWTDRSLASWDVEGFWTTVSSVRAIPFGAKEFVEEWCGILRERGRDVEHDAGAIHLVTKRERDLKGPLARIGNQAAIDKFTGAAGDGRYEFRWASALRIASDIRAGLANGADGA
jgi:hypothetical protein